MQYVGPATSPRPSPKVIAAADPQFVNAVAGDYHLRPTSPALDLAPAMSRSFDDVTDIVASPVIDCRACRIFRSAGCRRVRIAEPPALRCSRHDFSMASAGNGQRPKTPSAATALRTHRAGPERYSVLHSRCFRRNGWTCFAGLHWRRRGRSRCRSRACRRARGRSL